MAFCIVSFSCLFLRPLARAMSIVLSTAGARAERVRRSAGTARGVPPFAAHIEAGRTHTPQTR
eukprot:975184-Prymnesium_polylepis.1